MILLSIIIPVYNEERTIELIIKKVKSIPIEKEIIVIDDGSTDNSLTLLKNISNINLLKHDVNRGKGESIKTGLNIVRGDYVIFQDADLEYDPNDYIKLLEPLQSGVVDIVVGSRWKEKKVNTSLHYWGNKIVTGFFNLIYKSNFTDILSCYKILPANILKTINIESHGFGLETEISSKIILNKYKYSEIFISYKKRSIKEGKKIRLWDGFIILWTMIKLKVLQ